MQAPIDNDLDIEAVLRIQRLWRGYKARRFFQIVRAARLKDIAARAELLKQTEEKLITVRAKMEASSTNPATRIKLQSLVAEYEQQRHILEMHLHMHQMASIGRRQRLETKRKLTTPKQEDSAPATAASASASAFTPPDPDENQDQDPAKSQADLSQTATSDRSEFSTPNPKPEIQNQNKSMFRKFVDKLLGKKKNEKIEQSHTSEEIRKFLENSDKNSDFGRRVSSRSHLITSADQERQLKAVLVFQKMWRAKQARKRTKILRQEQKREVVRELMRVATLEAKLQNIFEKAKDTKLMSGDTNLFLVDDPKWKSEFENEKSKIEKRKAWLGQRVELFRLAGLKEQQEREQKATLAPPQPQPQIEIEIENEKEMPDSHMTPKFEEPQKQEEEEVERAVVRIQRWWRKCTNRFRNNVEATTTQPPDGVPIPTEEESNQNQNQNGDDRKSECDSDPHYMGEWDGEWEGEEIREEESYRDSWREEVRSCSSAEGRSGIGIGSGSGDQLIRVENDQRSLDHPITDGENQNSSDGELPKLEATSEFQKIENPKFSKNFSKNMTKSGIDVMEKFANTLRMVEETLQKVEHFGKRENENENEIGEEGEHEENQQDVNAREDQHPSPHPRISPSSSTLHHSPKIQINSFSPPLPPLPLSIVQQNSDSRTQAQQIREMYFPKIGTIPHPFLETPSSRAAAAAAARSPLPNRRNRNLKSPQLSATAVEIAAVGEEQQEEKHFVSNSPITRKKKTVGSFRKSSPNVGENEIIDLSPPTPLTADSINLRRSYSAQSSPIRIQHSSTSSTPPPPRRSAPTLSTKPQKMTAMKLLENEVKIIHVDMGIQKLKEIHESSE